MREYDEEYYNTSVQAKIDNGEYHICTECGNIISYGVDIDGNLYCPKCAREYVFFLSDNEKLDAIDYDRDHCILDVDSYIKTMSIEDIASAFDYDIWED